LRRSELPHTSLVDLPLVQVLNGTLVSAPTWYDNEKGYSTKLAETAARLVDSPAAQSVR